MKEIKEKILEQEDNLFMSVDFDEETEDFLKVIVQIDDRESSGDDIDNFLQENFGKTHDYSVIHMDTFPNAWSAWEINIFKDELLDDE